MEDYINKC